MDADIVTEMERVQEGWGSWAEERVAKQRDGALDRATGKEREGWSAGQRGRERNRMDPDSLARHAPTPPHRLSPQRSLRTAAPKVRSWACSPVSLRLRGVCGSEGAHTGPGRGGTSRSVTAFYHSSCISPSQMLNAKRPQPVTTSVPAAPSFSTLSNLPCSFPSCLKTLPDPFCTYMLPQNSITKVNKKGRAASLRVAGPQNSILQVNQATKVTGRFSF